MNQNEGAASDQKVWLQFESKSLWLQVATGDSASLIFVIQWLIAF